MLNEWTEDNLVLENSEDWLGGRKGEMEREQGHSSQGKRVSEGGGGLQLG